MDNRNSVTVVTRKYKRIISSLQPPGVLQSNENFKLVQTHKKFNVSTAYILQR